MNKPNLFPQPAERKSAMHRRVRDLLKEVFPGYTIIEEAPIDVIHNNKDAVLFVDIVVKELKLAVECHGRQHFEFVQHFHQTTEGFRQSQSRDAAKADAIRSAGYNLMTIRFDEWDMLNPTRLRRKVSKLMENASNATR